MTKPSMILSVQVVLDVGDIERAATFWGALLGQEPSPPRANGQYVDFFFLAEHWPGYQEPFEALVEGARLASERLRVLKRIVSDCCRLFFSIRSRAGLKPSHHQEHRDENFRTSRLRRCLSQYPRLF